MAKWYQWKDSAVFYNGRAPLVQDIGRVTDSLSQVHGGKVIYELNGKYYFINSIGDYYYWFISKYDFLFKKSAREYLELYTKGDNYGMAKFVKDNFTGKRLPIKYRFQYPSTQSSFPAPNSSPLNPDAGRVPTVVRFRNK